jgi:hypothetical protein
MLRMRKEYSFLRRANETISPIVYMLGTEGVSPMRVFAPLILAGVLTASAVGPQAPRVAGDATKVLAAAREALGGEKRLSAVRTFVANGRTQQVRGENLVPIEFEIACELPDKYVRRDEIPAQESGPTSTGFNGDAMIQLPPPPPPPSAPAGAPMPMPPGGAMGMPPGGRVNTVKQDFVRLTLGMFATSFASYPLTFSYETQAEAPQGKADVLAVKGPANFSLRLFVNTETHLPIMVSWNLPSPPGRGAPPATPAPPREARIYYADYRESDGLQLPFRLRRAIAGETVEETTFDRFRINVKIDPKKFEAATK